MGRAKNTIKASDISSTPIKVKYSVTYPSSSLLDYGITTKRGTNIPQSPTMSYVTMGRMNIYRLEKQLYYQYYLTGSVLNTASFFDPAWQSTAASGSNDEMKYSFPSAVNSNVSILTIPSSQFGEQISRNSFLLKSVPTTSPAYNIVDDGNGNIFDTLASNVHVGNIFYAQGTITITNPDYVGIILNQNFTII